VADLSPRTDRCAAVRTPLLLWGRIRPAIASCRCSATSAGRKALLNSGRAWASAAAAGRCCCIRHVGCTLVFTSRPLRLSTSKPHNLESRCVVSQCFELLLTVTYFLRLLFFFCLPIALRTARGQKRIVLILFCIESHHQPWASIPWEQGDRSPKRIRSWGETNIDLLPPKVSAYYVHLCIWYSDTML